MTPGELPVRITRILLTIVLLSITHPGCRVSGDAVASPTPAGLKSRTFQFEYVTRVKDFPAGAKLARVWIPLPQSDEAQAISDLRVDGVVDFEVTTEREYGNTMVYADFAAPLPETVELTVSFTVRRREIRQVSALRGAPERARLLEGDRHAALGPEVVRRGAEASAGDLSVIAPEIAENGNTVPIEISAPGAVMVAVFADGNPTPNVVTFKFGALKVRMNASVCHLLVFSVLQGYASTEWNVNIHASHKANKVHLFDHIKCFPGLYHAFV